MKLHEAARQIETASDYIERESWTDQTRLTFDDRGIMVDECGIAFEISKADFMATDWQPWEEPREYNLSYSEVRALCESCPSAEANSEHCDEDAWFHVDGAWFDYEESLVDFRSLDDAARCILGKWCIRGYKSPSPTDPENYSSDESHDDPFHDIPDEPTQTPCPECGVLTNWDGEKFYCSQCSVGWPEEDSTDESHEPKKFAGCIGCGVDLMKEECKCPPQYQTIEDLDAEEPV